MVKHAVIAGLAAGLLAGAAQAAATVAPKGRHPLADGQVLTALTVSYAPGESSGPHRHGAAAYVYVLSGEIRSQVEGEPAPRVYKAGESWFEPAGAHHLVSGNASRTAPASMLVVFVGPPEAVLTTADK
ncbi:MAG TPA: cupin domain-containing protein [Phenylobacterium sp.]|uniref:cupin domain-containing protein n=1 Tax=Phenylobacterium sp. TaxID=1871053 RepID=UPI002BD1602C|nr:cupin domain-containing protein [Phenylobacterium sp.]HSV04134.1 cupin domain-containing protein [Phenylobacterium sp.]